MKDNHEWMVYQEEIMKDKLKQGYIRDIRNPILSNDNQTFNNVFNLDELHQEIVYDFAQLKRDTLKLYKMEKNVESKGDFVNLNKL